MKKRILSIALCLVLALSLLPVSALAADISSVYISGVDHPVAGQPLDSTYNIPSAASYAKDGSFAEIIWYDLGKNASFPGKMTYSGPDATPLASGAAAVAGHSYVAALHLKRSGSDTFPKKSFTVNTADNMKQRLWGTDGCSKELSMSSYEGAVFLYYKADTAYDQWNSLYFDVARDFKGYVVAGESIWQAEEFSGLYNKSDFNLAVAWKEDGKSMTPGEKFLQGRTYTLTLTLTSPKYSNNASFFAPLYVDLANGAAGTDANVESQYRATATFTLPCREAVTELDVEGVKSPVAGEAIQTDGFTVAPAVATVKSAAWNKVSGTDTLTPAGGSFEPNTRYRLLLTLAPADGYYFQLSKSAVGANAGTVSSFNAYPDGEVIVGIDFNVGNVPNAPVAGVAVDVNGPKAGELPVYVATVGTAGCNVYADDGGSYIGGVCWLDVTEDPKLTDDERVLKTHKYDPFVGGHTYQIIIELAAQEGYQFADAPVATLNGQPTPGTYLQGEILRVVYTFPALPAELTGIAVTTPPAKTTYYAGEVFDETGMVVTASYSDGSSKAVTGFGTSPTGALSETDTEITVLYSEDDVLVTATTPITVKTAEKKLESIAITTPPTKTEYTAGKSFDAAGMVVTATYSDGSTVVVTGWTVTPEKLGKDDKTITVSYTEGKVTVTATQAVTVTAPKTPASLAVTTPPTKTEYYVGDSFAAAGMVVTVTYDDQTTAEVTDYTVTPTKLGKDDKAVTISYTENNKTVTATQAVTVKDEAKKNPFEDVKETDYFYDAVIWAYYATPQVTNGIDTTHFGPTSTVTRGQAVTFLWRAMGCPEPKTKVNPFADVKETEYYYKPILWAVEKGITKGTDDTHFTPMQTCSTAHILTFLYRTMGIGTDGWYAEAKGWAAGAGLLNGLNIEVAPGVDCPRCDVVLFLYRQLGT